jgi:hypothetical protein
LAFPCLLETIALGAFFNILLLFSRQYETGYHQGQAAALLIFILLLLELRHVTLDEPSVPANAERIICVLEGNKPEQHSCNTKRP